MPSQTCGVREAPFQLAELVSERERESSAVLGKEYGSMGSSGRKRHADRREPWWGSRSREGGKQSKAGLVVPNRARQGGGCGRGIWRPRATVAWRLRPPRPPAGRRPKQAQLHERARRRPSCLAFAAYPPPAPARSRTSSPSQTVKRLNGAATGLEQENGKLLPRLGGELRARLASMLG